MQAALDFSVPFLTIHGLTPDNLRRPSAELEVLFGCYEGLLTRGEKMAPAFEHALHSLRESPHVIDIRNIGLTAAVEFEPLQGKPGLRALKVFERGMEEGMLYRFTGETIAMAPPFISTQAEIGRMVEVLRGAIQATR